MIYICIPALNEARTIGVLLWKIRQVMDEFPRDYHVLVLDDGSTDDTREVLEPYLRVLPVTVLRNERTQGYAAGLERLLREAVQRSTHPKRDGVVTLQADFTESPDDIPVLLKRLEGGADIVGVTVTATEGELPRALRWSRRGLPWLLSRAPLPREVGDPLSGFRAYRVSVLRRALQDFQGKPMLTKHGWAVNAELLLAVLPHVRRAEGAEVSLRYTRRERATRFSPWSTAMELWDLARKAPRRLAAARAAVASADARADAAPQPQRAPAPSAAPAQAGHRSAAPAVQGAQRPASSPPAQRHAARPAQPPAAQKPAPRPSDAAQKPAPRPSDAAPQPSAQVAGDVSTEAAVDAVSAEAPAQAKPKRRRPPRRKSAAAKAAAAAQAEGAEPTASGEAAAASAPVPSSASADASAASPETAETGDSGDAAAAPKKRSRPRRPRRPRQAGTTDAPSDAPANEGGGEGGDGGE